MRRQFPFIAAVLAGLAAAYAVRGAEFGDVGKVFVVGLVAIVALYGVEYLLKRRR